MPLVKTHVKNKQASSTAKELIKADRGNAASTRVSAKKITEQQRTAVKTAVAVTIPPTQRQKNMPEPAAANAAQRRSKLFMDAMKEAGEELQSSESSVSVVDKLVNKLNATMPKEATPVQRELAASLLAVPARVTEDSTTALQKFVSIASISMPATMKQIINNNSNATRTSPISIDSFLGKSNSQSKR